MVTKKGVGEKEDMALQIVFDKHQLNVPLTSPFNRHVVGGKDDSILFLMADI